MKIADRVIHEVCGAYDVAPHEITGPSRVRKCVIPRHMVCAILRNAGFSHERIGVIINRDHTTVLHATRQARDTWPDIDPTFRETMERITANVTRPVEAGVKFQTVRIQNGR